ncbi:MAG TPA: MurT ligase domain-containing protein [Gaiellaceae bacterium]|nr:MurT ligase domain-containing protein [Gaiellaceae bacterium]
MRLPVPLAVEVAAARAVAGLSRAVGAGGGTTVPGKLLWKLDPGAIDLLAARLRAGSAVVSATNGKTTTAAMAADILRSRYRLAHNRSGANLLSGVASTLLAAGDADLGLLEVDEGALPEAVERLHPRAVCLGNLFRDQLDRYGELELVAERWRNAVSSLSLVVNADDPQLSLFDNATTFGIDDPSVARHALQHASDSKHCVRCGTPYHYTAAYIGHLGDYHCPNCGHARPPLDIVAHSIELHGLDRVTFELTIPEGSRRIALALPGLYNVYNALAAAALSRALGATLEEIAAGLEGFSAAFGRFERVDVGGKTVLLLLVKNPAGANEVVRTLVEGGAPRLAVIALNDAIADGRDVSWIWDVDFEQLLERLDTVIATGNRAAELALRCKYAGMADEAIVVEPNLEAAIAIGLRMTPADGELVVLPTYTAMLALRRTVAARPYWEDAA